MIEILIQGLKKKKAKDIFGVLKVKKKKDTTQLMKEVDKELWGE